jgi:DNA-nicking Smr family endonuclease
MKISDEDRKAFAEATNGVRPLKPPARVERRGPKPNAVARQARAATADMLAESITDNRGNVLGEEIGFRRPGVPERTFRTLRQGKFSIEDEIDLHGLGRETARKVLQDFIGACVDRRLGCVRVIHGKGTRSGPDGPVLKASVQQWLARWDAVLAFTTAQRRHGGTGAVYVLLGTR